MAFQRHNESVWLNWCRLSFPVVREPKPVMQQGRQLGVARFGALLILTEESVTKVRAIEERLIRASWPEWKGVTPPAGINLKRALQQGSVVRPNDSHLAGKWILSANSTPHYPDHDTDPTSPGNKNIVEDARPRVFTKVKDQPMEVPIDKISEMVYSGSEAHVHVGLYTTQLQTAAPQINVGLNLIQPSGRVFARFDGRPGAEAVASHDIEAPPPDTEGELVTEAPPQDDGGDSVVAGLM